MVEGWEGRGRVNGEEMGWQGRVNGLCHDM